MASQPALDSWHGARDWALEHSPGEASGDGWISRQDYEEKGGEYLSEHDASNVFIPMKLVKPVAVRPPEPSVTTQTPTATSAAISIATSVATDVSIVTS